MHAYKVSYRYEITDYVKIGVNTTLSTVFTILE